MIDGELNEISRAIGSLQEAARAAQRSHEAIWLELKEMRSELAVVVALKKDVDDMRPHVEDWRRTKQRGVGLLAAAGIGGGLLGQGVATLLRKIGLTP